jgi:hypothetical protein
MNASAVVAPAPNNSTVDTERALAELRWLALAVSTDETRPAIARIHVEGSEAVATDGHRLHMIEGTVFPSGFSLRGPDATRILELSRDYKLTEIQIWPGASRWLFESHDGRVELISNRSEYSFPDYKRVIPAGEAIEIKAADARKVFSAEGKPDYCTLGPGYFNAKYIGEALRGAPKKVKVIYSADEYGAAVLRYENRVAVVMPIRK